MKHGILSVVLCLLLFALPCSAQSIDLSEFTLDELTALLTEVYDEIGTRIKMPEETVGAGRYIAGVEIESGTYELLCTNIETRKDFSMCAIYLRSSNMEDSEMLYYRSRMQSGDKTTVTLADGNVLILEGGNFIITPLERSWSP